MLESQKIIKSGYVLETMLIVLEIMVFAVLGVIIASAIIAALVYGIKAMTPFYEHGGSMQGTQNKPMLEDLNLFKDRLLMLLDFSLVIIIGLDILRTIVAGVIRRELHAVAALEAAVLAVVREIISAEIRHVTVIDMLGLALVLAAVAIIWMMARHFGVIEVTAKKRQ